MLKQHSIYFGHQSVGENILSGVQLELGNGELKIISGENPKDLAPGTWMHSAVGKNEDPMSKINGFKATVDNGIGQQASVAFFKLCYIDIDAGTDVAALFGHYQETMDQLIGSYPSTTFVHVTTPLTIVQTGAKAWLKGVLGKPLWGSLENKKRQEYNALMRRHYGELVFDLAQLEATDGAGRMQTLDVQGQAVPYLASVYAADEGHLNTAGQRYIASHLLKFLAKIKVPEKRPAAHTAKETP